MRYLHILLACAATFWATSCSSDDNDDDEKILPSDTTTIGENVNDEDGEESDDNIEKETVSSEEVTEANNAIAEYEASKYKIEELATDAQITITWNGSEVAIEGSADGVETTTDGGAVTINSSTEKVIEYVLQGATTDGNIKIYSDHKYRITLNGVSLASKSTAAINNQGKKSLYIYAVPGTTSTLSDGTTYSSSSEDCKGCIFSEGQLIFCGTGILNINGNYKHGIASDDYLIVNQDININIKSSVKDAIHTNDYIVIEAGKISATNCGSDGLESDEGSIEINGGTLDITTSSTASKCIKAVGDISINGGTINLTAKGDGEWDSSDADYSNSACIKTSGALNVTGGNITANASGTAGRAIKVSGDANISGGTLTLGASGNYMQQSGQDYNAACAMKVSGNLKITGGSITAEVSGTGAKAIKVSGTYTQTDGNVEATATGTSLGASNGGFGGGFGGGRGGNTTTSSYTSRAKGLKITGAAKISGGVLNAYSKTHEALETKSTLDISGGEVFGYSLADDGINAASHITISGGYVCAYSTSNDGLDSNGDTYIKGGVIFAVGASSPEMAIDANTEGGYKLYISGGTIMTVGPLEGGSSLTQSCLQASNWNRNTRYALTVGNSSYVFTTPSGSAGSGIVVSGAQTPTLKSGVSVSGGTSHFNGVGEVIEGSTISGGTEVTLNSYSSNNGFRR